MSDFDQTLLSNLNEMQREAVLHSGSPLLILAGAGTGKTRVITVKIAWMVDELRIPPYGILAVTFTNKAAKEMKERLLSMSKEGSAVMIRTFHSFCAWLLRNYAESIGLTRNFNIYDDEESIALLKSLFPDFDKKRLRYFASLIARAKDYGLTYSDELDKLTTDSDFPQVYKVYQNRLNEIGNCDFGDLILKSVELLSNNPNIKAQVQQRFRAVLVDEYQDSNIAQFKLLQHLYNPDNYLCVVGDDDQSIYKFRGAEVENILTFQRHFPKTHIIKLEQNYRSTSTILDGASAVVANNSSRLGKKLWTNQTGGEPIKLYQLNDQKEEAALVVSLIDRANPQNTAVLFRTNAQSRPFEEALGKERIPYRLVGSLRFLEREEIKDIIAYLAFFLNSKDEIAFRRIVNKPARAIGPTTTDQILDYYRQTKADTNSILSAMQNYYNRLPNKGSKTATGIKAFISIYDEAAPVLQEKSLAAFVKFILDRSGLYNHYKDDDQLNATTKALNLDEFFNKAKEYEKGEEGLIQLLQDINLDNEVANSKNADEPGVVLITMHNTKGLEFEQVIVTGMEEGLFPSLRSEEEGNLEEERRICYVSMTRAKSDLVLSCCKSRLLYGRVQSFLPSRFLQEIPKQLLDIHVAKDPYSHLLKGDQDYSFRRKAINISEDDEDENLERKYSVGDGVYHSDYGEGMVTSSFFKNGKECLYVRFATGQEKYFIADYSTLEKIALE